MSWFLIGAVVGLGLTALLGALLRTIPLWGDMLLIVFSIALLAQTLRSAQMIYLLGGFPEYLATTLQGSLTWEAALEVFANGGVLAGSSAGAMVLCEHYYDPYVKKLLPGLNLVPGSCVLPHHNNFGREWVGSVSKLLPDTILVGIDEGTGMISDADGWQVYGKGGVTLYRPDRKIEVPSREVRFNL